MLAQSVSPTRIPDLIVVADRQDIAPPPYLLAIPFQGPTRLRFKVSLDGPALGALEAHLNSRQEVSQVRINRLAGSCVVSFEPTARPELDQWLAQLPSERQLAQGLNPSPGLSTTAAPSPGAGEADGEEPFVPTRIVLPVASLGLALLAGPLSLPPLAVAGFILVAAQLSFRRAWQGLREDRKINVDFLDSLAVVLHSLDGFLVGPAMMITMIEGGEAVRDATQRIAHSANTDLLASLQTDVRLLRDGEELIVPSSSLEAGDRIQLFAGDQIPVDGVIESGESSLDVVKLTGESVPREAGPGDEVLAGFILLEGSLIIQTSAVGEATRIGQITSMIESAPVFDTRVGNYAGKIANRFVMPTLALAGLSLLLSAGNIAQAASLLMFDLGTGLRVSVPTAIMAALTKAGSQGLLIRSGRALEQLADVDVVVFDKTGTLTQGHPSVVEVALLGNGDRDQLIRLAASAEQGLNHPVAEAVINHAAGLGMETLPCDRWDYRIGRGVSAEIQGQTVLVGNARLLREEGLEPAVPSADPRLATATPVYLAVDGVLEAVIYAADAIRPDSRQLIAELHRRGIQAHMLTGDVAAVAHAVAERLGLAPEEVHAEALPDQKAELVKQLAQQGHKVAFVGDGINDSAALAYADVSISFASGSDLARETADIVLTNDKVSGLLVAQDLSRRTFELVKQNIGIVGVPNLTALVVGTFLPISPILAVMLNNGSSLVAAANAMRVLGFRAKELPPANLATTAAAPFVHADSAPAAGPSATGTKGTEPEQARGTSEAHTASGRSASAWTSANNSLEVSLVQLSSRLSLSHQTITARRRRADFSHWVRSHDPEGQGWSYCSQTKMYRSVVA